MKQLLLLATILFATISITAQEYKEIEVTTNKTTHLTFPAKIRYVDLGSNDIIASTATGVDNVMRIKAAKSFKSETNFSVVCEDGTFYSFIVRYNENISQLLHEVNDPVNENEIKFAETNGESANLIHLIMKSLYSQSKTDIRHISGENSSVRTSVPGIYVYNKVLYIKVTASNNSNVAYSIDYVQFKTKDKGKIHKQQATQEKLIEPLRIYNDTKNIKGFSNATIIYAFPIFSLPKDKEFCISIFEKSGGRNVVMSLSDKDIVNAKKIKEITL